MAKLTVTMMRRISNARENMALDYCLGCHSQKHTTVCGMCLACSQSVVSERTKKSAYRRSEKRRMIYGSLSV
jgi:hypothetical protein